MVQCETCLYYDYDEEYEENICIVNFDEDEMSKFRDGQYKGCPYYKLGDEYSVVRKQM